MSEEIGKILSIIAIAILILFFVLGYTTGIESGEQRATQQINQKICKQLYQQNTNKYINCSTKDINENIKLIKDITND